MSNENKKGKTVYLPLDGFTSLTDGFETKESKEEKPTTISNPKNKKGKARGRKILREGIAEIIKSLEEDDKPKGKKSRKKME